MKQVKHPKKEKDSGKGRVCFRCTDEEIEWLNKECEKHDLTRAGLAKKRTFLQPLSMIPRFANKEL